MARRANKLSAEFLLAYILPMIAFDYSTCKGIVLFLIYFCVLSFLCVRNNNVYTNIFFELKNKELNESQRCRLEFWTQFNDVLEQRGKPFNKRKASTDHWYSVAVGSSAWQLSIELVNKEHRIRVCAWIIDNKDRFDIIHQHKDEIESELGFALSWKRMDSKKSSLICTYIDGLDYKSQENYPELINRSIDLVVKLRDVLGKYMKAEM